MSSVRAASFKIYSFSLSKVDSRGKKSTLSRDRLPVDINDSSTSLGSILLYTEK